MATRTAQRRLVKEYNMLVESPTPYVEAHPNESNILEWFYVITGPPDTPYQGGEYFGTLVFPADYPFQPPAIRMSTPSGRFTPDVRLCLSISDYHPDTWNPAWSVSTILVGLLSFMVGEENTAGSVSSSDGQRKTYARLSHQWNRKNKVFKREFPNLVAQSIEEPEEVAQASSSQPGSDQNRINPGRFVFFWVAVIISAGALIAARNG